MVQFRGISPQYVFFAASVRNYRAAALEFVREAGDPRCVGRAEVERWRRRIEQVRTGGAVRPAATSTVNVKIVGVRAFLQFLCGRGDRSDNPAEGLKLRREKKRLPQPIPPADVTQIVAAAQESDPQERAVAELFLGGGLRGSEVALLRLGWVEDREFLRVIGKGDKERLAPIPDAAFAALRDWVLQAHGDEESRAAEQRYGKDAAFLDLCQRRPQQGAFLSPAGTALVDPSVKQPRNVVYKAWKRVCRRAGVPEYNPHRARHYFATDILENGGSIAVLQKALGHQDLRTTLAYAEVTRRSLQGLRGYQSRPRMEV